MLFIGRPLRHLGWLAIAKGPSSRPGEATADLSRFNDGDAASVVQKDVVAWEFA
jgi:hypothetical protein